MRGIVVDDSADLLADRDRSLDGIEEADELLVANGPCSGRVSRCGELLNSFIARGPSAARDMPRPDSIAPVRARSADDFQRDRFSNQKAFSE